MSGQNVDDVELIDDNEMINLEEYDLVEIDDHDRPPVDSDDDGDVGGLEVMPEDEEGEEGDWEEMEEDVEDMATTRFDKHTDSVYAVAINPVDATMAASGGGDDIAYIWNTTDGSVRHELQGHTDSVVCVCFSADGKYVATGGMDGQALVWDAQTGQPVVACEGCTEVEWLDWHPRGHVLLGGSSDGNVWMWKVPSGHMMAVFAAHTDVVRAGRFTPDGKAVVTCAEDGAVIVWDPRTSEPTLKLAPGAKDWHDCPVSTVDVSPDNGIVASGGEDGTCKVVAVNSGRVVASLEGHEDSVETVVFSPQHPYLATGSLDGKLCIWETASGFRLRHTLTHGDGIVGAKWHPTQALVYTAALDRRVRLWDARTGECLQTWTGHTNSILGIAINGDGTQVATCADDHLALVFTHSP